MKKKKIAIVSNIYTEGDRMGINSDYVYSIEKAGAYPIIFPLINDEDYIEEILKTVDGIVLTGGDDINPLIYKEEPLALQGDIDDVRDIFDFKVIDKAIKLNKAILAICRGHQSLNVYFGGTLYQDVSYGYKDPMKHAQKANKNLGTHTVEFTKNSTLYNIFGDKVITNSYHHQCIKDLGEGVIATGHSKDGVIEGVEIKNHPNIISVQWHPEKMLGNEEMGKFFKYFVDMI